MPAKKSGVTRRYLLGSLLVWSALAPPVAPALELQEPPSLVRSLLQEAVANCDAAAVRRELAGSLADGWRHDLLLQAAETGCLQVVELLVADGAGPDKANVFGETALARAASLGQAEVVAFLAAKGADLDRRNGAGDPSLVLALRGDPLRGTEAGRARKTVETLLQAGAGVNEAGEFGRTPLIWAVLRADAATVWLLLQHGADPGVKDEEGRTAADLAEQRKLRYLAELLRHPERPELAVHATTALAEAVRSNRPEAVAAALAQGAAVNGRTGNGSTPLMLAAAAGNAEMVRLLAQKGGALDADNGGGATALVYAAAAGHLPVLRLLLESGAVVQQAGPGGTALAFAVREGQLEAARLLLEHGADANERVEGTPLLTQAISAEREDMARLLVASGAAIDVVNDDGRTPLQLACDKGYTDLVGELLARGADPNHASEGGESPLGLAIAGNHEETVRLLLGRGATAGRQQLAAALAAGNGPLAARLIEAGAPVEKALLDALPGADLELVRLLVGKGADPKARDSAGKTPLLRSIGSWPETSPEVLQFLLQHGARVNDLDDEGQSPLLAAAGLGLRATAQLLLAHGADPRLMNKNGKSAWMLAAQRNDRPLLELLEQHGAQPQYAGLSWSGNDARQKEAFIRAVTEQAEWDALWQRAFAAPAPPVDFSSHAVACVFLGDHADWLYSILLSQPRTEGQTTRIHYALVMNQLRLAPGAGSASFGGQYHMEVVPRQPGEAMELVEDQLGF